MSAGKKVLLLIGSPKIRASSSESLGSYLLDRLREKGCKTEILHINRSLKTTAGQEELLERVDGCDILLLAFPLYADSLPSGVIKCMELLAQNRKVKPANQVLVALCNSGFPEAHQNNIALAICRCFAKEVGFSWAGGLPLGGGGAINGQPLDKVGGMMKNVKKGLDLTAQALANGSSIPEEAVALFSQPLFPGWLYLMMGNLSWKLQALKNGVLMQMNNLPYK